MPSELDSRMQGSRYSSGKQRWEATETEGPPQTAPPGSEPSGTETIIESNIEPDEAKQAGTSHTFATREAAQKFLQLIDHGIPPEMAEDLVS